MRINSQFALVLLYIDKNSNNGFLRRHFGNKCLTLVSLKYSILELSTVFLSNALPGKIICCLGFQDYYKIERTSVELINYVI